MSTIAAMKRRRWKLRDDSILRDSTSDASSSRLSNRQANLPELFALSTTQSPNADQGYKRRCDVAEYATLTPDLGAFHTMGFSAVSLARIGVGKGRRSAIIIEKLRVLRKGKMQRKLIRCRHWRGPSHRG
ncbi:hypothetical protein MRX96_040466 [Rhipicephalus microplus]